MSFKAGDVVIAKRDYNNTYHKITKGARYVLKSADSIYIELAACDKRSDCSGCSWSEYAYYFEADIPLSQEEIDRALPLPSLDDVASFVSHLSSPRIEG